MIKELELLEEIELKVLNHSTFGNHPNSKLYFVKIASLKLSFSKNFVNLLR